MKICRNIFCIILSFLLFFMCFFQSFFISNASLEMPSLPEAPTEDELILGSKNWKDMSVNEKVLMFSNYIVSQVGAVTSGDFSQYLANTDDFREFIKNSEESNIPPVKYINGLFSFSKDLIDFIKKSLKKYAEETNGYIICPTIHFSTLSPSTFGSSYQYQTAKSLVNEDGICAVMFDNRGLLIKDIPGYLDGSAGFYINNSYGSGYYLFLMDLKSWSLLNYGENSLSMNSKFEKVIHDWEEAASSDAPSDGFYYYGPSQTVYSSFFCPASKDFVFNTKLRDQLVSKDGRNVLVFKSKAALQNYSVEHRSVYFGSKFYDETGAVTAAFDDLQDWLDGKYDDFWEKIKDLIPEGSNLTEDDLEKIVDKLLDQLGEIGDRIDENSSVTNSLLADILAALGSLDDSIASALSGVSFDTSMIEKYLSSILDRLDHISDDLDGILDSMDGLAEDEIQGKSESLVSALSAPFSEVASVAKTKFPFSLPWELEGLFTVLNGGTKPGMESLLSRMESYSLGPSDVPAPDSGFVEVVSYSGGSGSSPGYGGVSLYAHEETPGKPPDHPAVSPDASGAPVFAIPLVVKSAGISSAIVIRMSLFGGLAVLCRRVLLLLFIYQLVLLSIRIFDFMKGMIE